jgi:hypothetical protein
MMAFYIRGNWYLDSALLVAFAMSNGVMQSSRGYDLSIGLGARLMWETER